MPPKSRPFDFLTVKNVSRRDNDMKFSELSYRDYIAIECAGHFAGIARSPQMAATAAYAFADAMLVEAGKRNHEMEELRERAATAERTNSILLNMGENFAARVALLQIWELLDVRNQTEAMQILREKIGDRA